MLPDKEHTPYPPLRNIEAFPIHHQGQTLICLHDPLGYVPTEITLSPAAFFIAACLDGNHTLRDIQLEFAREFQGALIPSEEIENIVNFLDEHGFLLNERFQEIKTKIETEFLQQKVRMPYHAGVSYSSARHELGAFIASFFTREGGPGPLPPEQESPTADIVGLIAPHIDFNRGSLGYAYAYYKLYQSPKPDTVLILGVSHNGGDTPYIMTRKHFSTPLGTLITNQDFIDYVLSQISFDPFQSEIMHRMEHSIEFQVLMLNYLFGTNVKIVPILCAPIDEQNISSPAEIPQINEFINACINYTNQTKERILILAGADLAHVGRRFGDPFTITQSICDNIKQRDYEDLKFAIEINPEKFYSSVNKDHNKRRVCGLFSIYTLLKIINGTAQKGQLLYYGQAPDPIGGIVSFASLAFYR